MAGYEPSKEHLIAAYLERANEQFWDWLDEAVAGIEDPEMRLIGMFEAIEDLATNPAVLDARSRERLPSFPTGTTSATGQPLPTSERFTSGSPSWLTQPDSVMPTGWPINCFS